MMLAIAAIIMALILYTLTLDEITVSVQETIFVRKEQLHRRIVLPEGLPGNPGKKIEEEYMHTW